jgi:hypothetical protein
MSHVTKSSFEAVFSDFKSNSSLDSLLALFCGFEQALSSAKTRRPSCSASQEAVLVMKSVQDGVRHNSA